MIAMEVEVKAKVKDMVELKKKFEDMGASFNTPVSQVDAYFKPKGFDEKPEGPGSWIVRIRDSNDKKTLTLKALTEILGAWVEYETAIENGEQARKILDTMGLVNVFTLNKKRSYGKIGEFEVLLDDVKELGEYLEVALESDEKEKTREKIINFMKSAGISESDIERRGYGEIIGEKLGHRFGGMR